MSEETRQHLVAIVVLIQRVLQEVKPEGRSRDALVEIHEDCQTLLDDELARR